MKPMFTIHIGEYLVGEQIEKLYGSGKKAWRVWTPSRDTGIDLLVTSADCREKVSLQVKYSKTYSPPPFECKSFGWWSLNREKIERSTADFWIFVWPQFPGKDGCIPSVWDFVIIKPNELLKRLDETSKGKKVFRINLANIDEEVVETRGIDARGKGRKKTSIPEGIQRVIINKASPRNYTGYFNNWQPLEKALEK